MKANELMIGDWVLYNETHRQILEISGIDDEVYLETDELVVHQSEIQPIPLTQEILEKNGFVQDGESWWYQDFRIVLSASKGVSLVCGRQVKFCYIHQLQHALRLCGIEKTIEL